MAGEKILVVDDDRNQCMMLGKILELEGYRVVTDERALDALDRVKKERFDLVLSDLRMPDLSGLELLQKMREAKIDTPLVIMTAFGSLESAIQSLRDGVYDYVTKPINLEELMATLNRAFEMHKLREENRALRQQISAREGLREIIGRSAQMQRLMESIDMVAPSDATILIESESGTGKELVAEAIHAKSPRAERPLVKVNCGAIPENLLEDELFGHEKGAFTGAESRRRGRFEMADGGTVFLDEIGEMPTHLQVKLLRVLQERRFERLGGSQTISVDVRVIAATNMDLEQAVTEGRFREDLYYRINVVQLQLPPLRERREDVLLLASYFLKRFCEQNDKPIKTLSNDAEQQLLEYSWPGNVRELENCMERAVIMGRGDEIGVDDLQFGGRQAATTPQDKDSLLDGLFEESLSLSDVEKELIRKALEKTAGNQSKAAELLGLTRRTLQYRIEKYGLSHGN